MFYIPDNNIFYFDVDDTLVMHDSDLDEYEFHRRCVKFHLGNGIERWLVPHRQHIADLKARSKEGAVVVWSQGGAAWAKQVVEKLGLSDYVTCVMAKPTEFWDDLATDYFMPEAIRVWKKDE